MVAEIMGGAQLARVADFINLKKVSYKQNNKWNNSLYQGDTMKLKMALITIYCAVAGCAFACDHDYKREYFTENGHEYLLVTGFCRGKIQYVVHTAECECGAGLYEVKWPTSPDNPPPVKGDNGPKEPR